MRKYTNGIKKYCRFFIAGIPVQLNSFQLHKRVEGKELGLLLAFCSHIRTVSQSELAA